MRYFQKKVSRKILEIQKSPDDYSGDSGGCCLSNPFLRLYVCVYNIFVINSSGRSPRNFGGSALFVKKFRNFGNFWKILEIFGKFWKFLEIFGKFLEKYPGGKKFWKFLEIFAKIFENCKKLEI